MNRDEMKRVQALKSPRHRFVLNREQTTKKVTDLLVELALKFGLDPRTVWHKALAPLNKHERNLARSDASAVVDEIRAKHSMEIDNKIAEVAK